MFLIGSQFLPAWIWLV